MSSLTPDEFKEFRRLIINELRETKSERVRGSFWNPAIAAIEKVAQENGEDRCIKREKMTLFNIFRKHRKLWVEESKRAVKHEKKRRDRQHTERKKEFSLDSSAMRSNIPPKYSKKTSSSLKPAASGRTKVSSISTSRKQKTLTPMKRLGEKLEPRKTKYQVLSSSPQLETPVINPSFQRQHSLGSANGFRRKEFVDKNGSKTSTSIKTSLVEQLKSKQRAFKRLSSSENLRGRSPTAKKNHSALQVVSDSMVEDAKPLLKYSADKSKNVSNDTTNKSSEICIADSQPSSLANMRKSTENCEISLKENSLRTSKGDKRKHWDGHIKENKKENETPNSGENAYGKTVEKSIKLQLGGDLTESPPKQMRKDSSLEMQDFIAEKKMKKNKSLALSSSSNTKQNGSPASSASTTDKEIIDLSITPEEGKPKIVSQRPLKRMRAKDKPFQSMFGEEVRNTATPEKLGKGKGSEPSASATGNSTTVPNTSSPGSAVASPDTRKCTKQKNSPATDVLPFPDDKLEQEKMRGATGLKKKPAKHLPLLLRGLLPHNDISQPEAKSQDIFMKNAFNGVKSVRSTVENATQTELSKLKRKPKISKQKTVARNISTSKTAQAAEKVDKQSKNGKSEGSVTGQKQVQKPINPGKSKELVTRIKETSEEKYYLDEVCGCQYEWCRKYFLSPLFERSFPVKKDSKGKLYSNVLPISRLVLDMTESKQSDDDEFATERKDVAELIYSFLLPENASRKKKHRVALHHFPSQSFSQRHSDIVINLTAFQIHRVVVCKIGDEFGNPVDINLGDVQFVGINYFKASQERQSGKLGSNDRLKTYRGISNLHLEENGSLSSAGSTEQLERISILQDNVLQLRGLIKIENEHRDRSTESQLRFLDSCEPILQRAPKLLAQQKKLKERVVQIAQRWNSKKMGKHLQ
eukprot:snap_masked-scaffold_7-processed-gene-8.41-mRNA-1 protein AED:1.00 eAED:1.00 QI:0/0/0/0/1/1/3/0/921